MTLTRKDAVATSLTGLAVLAFLATHEAWNVPLIGDSHRWAAAVIMVLGVGARAAGARRVTATLFSVLGGAAFVLGVLALITGSRRDWSETAVLADEIATGFQPERTAAHPRLHATTRPAPRPGAQPPLGGLIDSAPIPLVAITHAITGALSELL